MSSRSHHRHDSRRRSVDDSWRAGVKYITKSNIYDDVEHRLQTALDKLHGQKKNANELLGEVTGMVKNYTLGPTRRARRYSHSESTSESKSDSRMEGRSGIWTNYSTSSSGYTEHGRRERSKHHDDVSERTRLRCLRREGFRCWACESRNDLDVSYVLSSESKSFESHNARGVIDFSSPNHSDNLLTLCTYCRSDFEDHDYPSWIFIPSDLGYFIQFEDDDYDRRVEAASKGIPLERSVPMPQSIHYTRYVLSSRSTRLTSMSTTRSWSGSPTAAILHAAEVILQLKPYENTPLKHLQDRTRLLLSLYARPSPQVIETVPNLKDIPCGVDAHELGKVEMRKRAEKYLQDIRRSGTKGRKAYSELKDKHLLIDVDGSWYEDSDSDEQDDRDYHWGPKSSSADKIKFVRKKGVEPVYDMMFGP